MANTPKHVLDNRANQLNPTHPVYYIERGLTSEEAQELALIQRHDYGRSVKPNVNKPARPNSSSKQKMT